MNRPAVVLLLACASAWSQEYDVLIRGARLVDGTGNPWVRADVAVKAGRIAAVGRLTEAKASRVIEANGRVLAPGFIDVHTHIESGIERSPAAENFLRDGVTTLVTGNCGSSRPDLAAFFAALEKTGIGVNVASLIGHNTVRAEVMGGANRQATGEELTRMAALVEKGMRAGAVGFSTGLEYVPGTYAGTPELVRLAKVAAGQGGVYASHMRDEGEAVLDAMREAIQVGREAGLRVHLSHLKQDTPALHGTSREMVAVLDEARVAGLEVTGDQYPYTAYSTGLGVIFPTWALADGQAKVKERFTEPATRGRIAAETVEMQTKKGNRDLSYMTVASCAWDRSLEGKTVSAITLAKGRKAGMAGDVETAMEMLAQGGASFVFQAMGAEDVERLMRHAAVAVASDGGVVAMGQGRPHPRSYGTNARVLAEYVRRKGTLGLEEAVRKMTSLPARTFRLPERGQVRVGYWADLVLFDPEKVADRATFDAPHAYSEGFDLVLVNGEAALEGASRGTARAGRVLRRAGE